MLSEFYSKKLNPELLNELNEQTEKNKGTSGADLKQLLQASDFEVVVFPGDLSDKANSLYHQINLGRPLIVMIGPKLKRHYMLAVGFDAEKKIVIFNDPLNGKISFTEESFLKFWETANFFTLLAIPNKQLD